MLMTARETASALAVSVRTLWRLAATGEVPAPIQVGGSTRWVRKQIEAYVAEKTAAAERDRQKIAARA